MRPAPDARRALRCSLACAAGIGLVACGAPIDRDQDGVPADEDCDDRDPWVYPGAPDTPGDGLDADCDGEDAAFTFLGDWTLRLLSAGYSGVQVLQAETASGALRLGEDLSAVADFGVTLSAAVTGDPLPVRFLMEGELSALPGPARFHLTAEGDNYGELMHIDWDCAVEGEGEDAGEGEAMRCAGEFKGFDSSLDAAAELVAAD